MLRRPRLILVLGPASAPFGILHTAKEAIRGGVDALQLRDKKSSLEHIEKQARVLSALCREHGIPFWINDLVALAREDYVDALHIGQSDGSPRSARQNLGAEKALGLSIETREQLVLANDLPVDIVSLSPLFATQSKDNCGMPWELEGLSWARSQTKKHLVVIGGIDRANVGDAIKYGADGVAVVSAIASSKDPCSSARELRDIIDQGLKERSDS